MTHNNFEAIPSGRTSKINGITKNKNKR